MIIRYNSVGIFASTMFLFVYWFKLNYGLYLIALIYLFLLVSLVINQKKVHHDKYDAVFLGYIFIVTIIEANNNSLDGLYRYYVIFPYLIFKVFQILQYNRQTLKIILGTIAISSFIVGCYIFYQNSFGQFNFSITYFFTKSRKSFIFLNPDDIVGPNVVSNIFNISLFAILSLFKHKRNNPLYIATILYLSIQVLVIMGRVSWVNMFMAILLTIYFPWKNIKVRQYLSIPLFIALSLYLFYESIPYLSFIQSDIFSDRIQVFYDLNPTEAFSAREIRWYYALQEIQHSWTGNGLRYFVNKYGLGTAHNEWLGQYISLGLLGVVNFFLLMVMSVNIVFSNMKYYWNYAGLSDYAPLFLFSVVLLVSFFVISFTEHFSESAFSTYYPILWVIIGINSSINFRNREMEKAGIVEC